MILASTRVGLPFYVRLPANFAITSEEIGTYEANYRWSGSGRFLASLFSPYDHAAMLVFWKYAGSIMAPKDVSALITGSVGGKGRATPRKDLVVVNCLESLGDGKVRWKLAKKRVEGMKREGDWEMAIFRSDGCVIGKPFRIPLPPVAPTNGEPDVDMILQPVLKFLHHNGGRSPLKRTLGRHPVRLSDVPLCHVPPPLLDLCNATPHSSAYSLQEGDDDLSNTCTRDSEFRMGI